MFSRCPEFTRRPRGLGLWVAAVVPTAMPAMWRSGRPPLPARRHRAGVCLPFFPCLLAAALVLAAPVRMAAAADTSRVLHVVADPNNLPFSNARGEGFENKIVELIARELGARVEYTWWAQRRGWVRQTMKERNGDLVAGVPWHFERMLTSRPYYASTYMLVYRTDRQLGLRSLDDPQLRRLLIGVQMIGDDFANTPPAHALSRRGIINNIRGYTVYGDYQQPNPPARILDAVLHGDIDVALVWGPLAGYYARQHQGRLTLVPLPPFDAPSRQPFTFRISVGIRKNEPALRDEVNAILLRKKPEIDAILGEYGVPRAPVTLATLHP